MGNKPTFLVEVTGLDGVVDDLEFKRDAFRRLAAEAQELGGAAGAPASGVGAEEEYARILYVNFDEGIEDENRVKIISYTRQMCEIPIEEESAFWGDKPPAKDPPGDFAAVCNQERWDAVSGGRHPNNLGFAKFAEGTGKSIHGMIFINWPLCLSYAVTASGEKGFGGDLYEAGKAEKTKEGREPPKDPFGGDVPPAEPRAAPGPGADYDESDYYGPGWWMKRQPLEPITHISGPDASDFDKPEEEKGYNFKNPYWFFKYRPDEKEGFYDDAAAKYAAFAILHEVSHLVWGKEELLDEHSPFARTIGHPEHEILFYFTEDGKAEFIDSKGESLTEMTNYFEKGNRSENFDRW
jgi:hypothetical protein